MRRSALVRVLAVAFAAGSLLTITAGPAVAAPKVACTKATIKSDLKKFTSTSVMSGCSNPSVSGGQGTLVANFKNLKKITAKITWKGKGTTSYLVTEKAGPKVNKCKTTGKTKDALIVSTGKFTAGTGVAGTALKGLVYKESLCVRSTDSSTYLLPGSKITFG